MARPAYLPPRKIYDGPPVVVKLDERGRVAIKKVAKHELFFVKADDDGVITLTPVAIVPWQDMGTGNITESRPGEVPDMPGRHHGG